ncbi:MAG: hypothetical protein M1826_001986 [Phylliscum demangeonii]|nr:MAG: hypothetical protein M1826_001986 [Phylliscum demangeonii]
MPAALFQEKDYLNYRYFFKRAYYLACIAAGLKALDANRWKMNFELWNGNTLQPVLRLLLPPDEDSAKGSSLQCLRDQATISLKMLNEANFDPFDALFIIKVDRPLGMFDLIAQVPWLKVASSSPDHVSETMALCRKIYHILKKGLSDRAHMVYPASPNTDPWSIKDHCPAHTPNTLISVRVVLNPSAAGRLLDLGPTAEHKTETDSFQKFWGSKAELRRFKDGSILESVVWTTKDSKVPVVQQIILYLLERHLKAGITQSVNFVDGSFNGLLCGGLKDGLQALAPFRHFAALYHELEMTIRGLPGLPLQVRHVAAAGSCMRHASTDVLDSSRAWVGLTPSDVQVQFEGSGRWPDDLAAIQRTKIALLLKMAELLAGSKSGLVSRLGLENEKYTVLNRAFLDVIFPGKAAFRLRIHHERERSLLEQQICGKNLGYRSREEAVHALAEYKRLHLHAPSHTQMIQIHCSRFPLLSPTMLLVKKWFYSHLLCPHFCEEVIELLVLRTFTQPWPWAEPSSASTGFLRTIFFLSKWDWRAEPLVIDHLGEALGSTEVKAIHTRFEAWRKIDPGMVKRAMFVASKLDLDGDAWTHTQPSKVVAARMTMLARSAYQVIKETGLDLKPTVLFSSPATDYHFLLHLHPRFAARRHGHAIIPSQPQYKNLQLVSCPEENVSQVGFDPVGSFVDELQSLYTSHVLFFYDPTGAAFIAGLWNPASTVPRPWKVVLSYSTQPVHHRALASNDGRRRAHRGGVSAPDTADDTADDDDARLEMNRAAVLNEIARLAGEMVSRVEVIREP